MGWEHVTVGYFGEEDETEWQRQNEDWMDKVGMDSIGDYWVNIQGNRFLPADSLCYHESWNELMPVVEKISLMNYPDEPTFPDEEDYVPDTAYPRTFGMISRNGQFMVRLNRQPLFEADTLIEAAWKAVVDFVQWQQRAETQ